MLYVCTKRQYKIKILNNIRHLTLPENSYSKALTREDSHERRPDEFLAGVFKTQ